MTREGALERRYRRLLRLLPRPQREARGDEMLGVLLDRSRPGQRRPGAADTADLVVAATRSRLHLLLVADPVARVGAITAAVLLLIAMALAAGDLHLRGSLAGVAPSSGPVLVDRFPSWQPKPMTVSQAPAGPAMMAYVDGSEDLEEFVVVLGADGSTLRRVPLADGSKLASGMGPTLLSVDGRRLAQARSDGGIAVTDLFSGRTHTLRDPALVVGTDGPTLLAWSDDSSRVVVQAGQGTGVTDLADGRTVTLPGGTAASAAFAADGRFALVQDGSVAIYAADSRLLGRSKVPDGWQIAPAGWSRSGDVLAMTSRGDELSDSALRAGHPGLRVSARGAVPALLGSPDHSEPVVWRGPDLLMVEAGGSLVRWHPASGSSEMVTELGSSWFKGDLRLASGLVDTARIMPLGALNRGLMPLRWLVAAGGFALVALVMGWCYPLTQVRLATRTTRAAVRSVSSHGDLAFMLALAASPVVFVLMITIGFEVCLVPTVVLVLAASAYALGRSLGRARYVTASRLLGAGHRRPAPG